MSEALCLDEVGRSVGADLLQALSLCFAPCSTFCVVDACMAPRRLESQRADEPFADNGVTFLNIWAEELLPSTWHIHHLSTGHSSKVQIQVFHSAPCTNIGGE